MTTPKTYQRLVQSQSQITCTRLDDRSQPVQVPLKFRAFVPGPKAAGKSYYWLPDGILRTFTRTRGE